MRKRVTGVLIAVLLAALGFAAVSQARTSEGDDLSGLRANELADLLRSLDARSQRLSDQIDDLTATRDALQGSDRDSQAAEDAAQARANQLAILAGTVPVSGPGITLTLTEGSPGDLSVTASTLLNAIEELRDAGAESIVINDSVRVVAQTYFLDDQGGIRVGNQVLAGPYVISAIGNADTMSEAMKIRGGVIELVEDRGGSATVVNKDSITIEALAETPDAQYAQVDN